MDHDLVDGEAFNAGYENKTLDEIADLVKGVVGDQVEIRHTPTDDNRSYHISSEKIGRVLDYRPAHTIEDAVRGLVEAFHDGRIPDAMTSDVYYNLQRMQRIELR